MAANVRIPSIASFPSDMLRFPYSALLALGLKNYSQSELLADCLKLDCYHFGCEQTEAIRLEALSYSISCCSESPKVQNASPITFTAVKVLLRRPVAVPADDQRA